MYPLNAQLTDTGLPNGYGYMEAALMDIFIKYINKWIPGAWVDMGVWIDNC